MTSRCKRVLAAMLAALITVSGSTAAVVSAAEVPQPVGEVQTTQEHTITDGDFTYEEVDGKLTVLRYNGEESVVEIPERVGGKQVVAVSADAFAACNTVTEITLPKTITKLGADAFANCTALQKLYLQNNAPETERMQLPSNAKVIVLGKNTEGYNTALWNTLSVIFANDLHYAVVEKIPNQTYVHTALEPEITVTDYLGNALQAGKDFKVTYSQNQTVGTAVASISGIGDYFGTVEENFTITAKDGSEQFRVEGIVDQVYTGTAITQNISVYDGDILLKENEDYTVTYRNNTMIGTAEVIITGIGNYSGNVKRNFSIAQPFSDEAEIIGVEDRVYNGQEQTQTITVKDGVVLREGIDYTVAYENNTNVGTAKVIVTGKGKYTGTLTKTFSIAAISVADVQMKTEVQVYTGHAITPDLTVTYKDTTLVSGRDYTVQYKNNVEIGTASATVVMQGNYTGEKTVTFKITPVEVTGFQASVTTNAVTLSWDPVEQATGYRLYRWDAERNTWALLKDGNVLSYTHTNLDSGTEYRYAVKAYKKVNGVKYSGTYPTISVMTKLAKLTGLKAAKTTEDSVKLTWNAVNGAEAYLVYRRNDEDTKWIKLGSTTELTYTDSDLASATTYQYAVKGYRILNGKQYNGGYPTLLTSTNPEKLKNLRASKTTTSSIQLTWDAVPGVAGYRVYRWNEETNTWKRIKETTGTSCTDSGLDSGTTYQYAAKAYCVANGTRYYGTYPTVNLSTTPGSLTGLTAKTKTNSVTLTWNAVSGAEGYYVYRWDNNKNNWVKIGEAENCTYTDSGLDSGTKYKYTARAYRIVDGKLYRGGYPSLSVATAPAKLTGLCASENTDSSVTLTWDAVEGATGYLVYRWDTGKGTWKKVKDTTALSYTDKNLASGTEYKYATKAYVTVDGVRYNGSYPTIVTATAPGKLSGLKAKTTTNSVTLTWNAETGADGYYVYRKNSETGKLDQIGNTTKETYTDKNLDAATKYTYSARAYKTIDGEKLLGGNLSLTIATAPTKLTGLKASKVTMDTITLKWDAVEGATGYRAYRWNAAKNTWTLLKDINGGNVTSYKVSGLSEDTEYKFAVKAYKTADGVKYSGAYPTITAKTKAKVLLDVPYWNQNAWPTGCEATSTTMVLDFYGVKNISIRKVVNAMPKGNLYYYNGNLYGPHPDDAFIGSPDSYSGFGCYAGTVEYTMNTLLPKTKVATAIRGLSMTEVEKYLDHGQPVIFWASMYMGETYPTSTWYVTGTNRTYTWTANEHCLVLVGYDSKYYYFNDPLQPNNNGGLVKWNKSLVATRYAELGKQIVVVSDK